MTENFTQAFEQLLVDQQEQDVAWLNHLRREGYMQFAKVGLPSLGDEEWKYTSLRSIKEQEFRLTETLADQSFSDRLAPWCHPEEATLLLVNGRFHSWLSPLVAGTHQLQLQSLRDAILEKPELIESWLANGFAEFDRFFALNQAFLLDGLYLAVGKNQSIRQPLHVIHLVSEEQSQRAVFNRLLLHMEPCSELSLRETYLSLEDSSYFCNPVTQLKIEQGAKLRHQRLQSHSLLAIHIDSLYVSIGRDAEYKSLQIDLGAQLARHQVYVSLVGKGASLRIDGVTIAGEQQHIDQQTSIDHVEGQTQSSQLYKSVVGKHGRSVFSGQIAIKPHAQQTKAFQLNQNLLLSKDAEADTRPQMIIDADDVQCSHGATIGQLSEDELFYLRSRGIDAETARSLLIDGFLREVLQRHEDAPGIVSIQAFVKERVARLYGV